jgi:hypothetical protein
MTGVPQEDSDEGPYSALAVRQRIRWGPVSSCTLAGLACTCLPFLLEARSQWRSVETAILTNLGTALLLGALLFFLERTFVQSVRRVATTAARRAATDATADLRRTTEGLVARVDELQALTRARVESAAREQDEAVARLRESVSFANVTEAFAYTNQLKALSTGTLVVPASADVRGPRLKFMWGIHLPGSHKPPGQRLEIDLVVERNPDPASPGTPIVGREWPATMSPEDVTAEFDKAMRRSGFAPEANALDWGVAFERLGHGLATAIAARRGDRDAWISAPLVEVITEDWAITEAGVEVRGHGRVLASQDFPQREATWRTAPPSFDPPRPEWADATIWEVAVRRACSYHPRGPGLAASMFGARWLPATGVNV